MMAGVTGRLGQPAAVVAGEGGGGKVAVDGEGERAAGALPPNNGSDLPLRQRSGEHHWDLYRTGQRSIMDELIIYP